MLNACRVVPENYYYMETIHGPKYGDYILVYNHVQLALKYTPLTNTHTKYLENLMKPYSFHKDKGELFFASKRPVPEHLLAL